MPTKVVIGLALTVIVIGLGIGFLLSRSNSSSAVLSESTGSKMVSSEKEVGSTDTKAFPDSANGTLEKGGLGNEGTHHLTRDGGPSQTVYVISSVVDLDQFVGKKVQIWGQTLKATKAPWLMDVDRVKLTE